MVEKFLLCGFVLFISIALHEIGHAFVAYILGDDTAKKQKRFYLHTHFDLFGSLILPVSLFIFGSPFVIGYAKPVRVNPKKFEDPLIDLALVGLAGPIVNFILAGIFALLLLFQPKEAIEVTIFSKICLHFVIINLGLAFFNLIPIPPLDGSRVVINILHKKLAVIWERLEIFGIFLIFAIQLISLQIAKIFDTNYSLFYVFIEAPVKYIVNLILQ